MLQSCAGLVTNHVSVGCWTCDKPCYSPELDLWQTMFQSAAGPVVTNHVSVMCWTCDKCFSRLLDSSDKPCFSRELEFWWQAWNHGRGLKPFLNNMRCWLRKSWSAGNREYFGQEIELIEDIREIEVVYQTQNSDEMLVRSYTCHDSHDLSMKR